MSTSAVMNSSATTTVCDDLVAPEGQRVAEFTRQFFDGVPDYMTKMYTLIRYRTIAGSKAVEYTFQHIVDKPQSQENTSDRRLVKDDGPEPRQPHVSLNQLIPNPEPEWFIEYRRRQFVEIGKLNTENQRLREQIKNMTTTDNLALATYGEKQDLAVVKERVSLTTYGATLSDAGRAMVAQLCWMMDWNPFFDVHAFPSKGGRIVVTPDYKKLIEIVREKERINYETRPMTPKEREEFGLNDDEVGGVVEITEVDIFLDFVKAGVGDQYHRIKGYGVWRPGDTIPSTWTALQVASKRAIRNGLAHLTSYKLSSKRLQQALEQAGAIRVEESEDGFAFDPPPASTEPDQPAPVIIDQLTPPEKTAEMVTLDGEVVTISESAALVAAEPTEPAPVVEETPAPKPSELDPFLGPRNSEPADAHDPERETPESAKDGELSFWDHSGNRANFYKGLALSIKSWGVTKDDVARAVGLAEYDDHAILAVVKDAHCEHAGAAMMYIKQAVDAAKAPAPV